MSNRLANKICLVTGTSKGIGKKIAELFAEHGAVVYANARNVGCLEDWAYQVSDCVSGEIRPIYFDVSNSDSVRGAILKIKSEAKRMDVLVNNAGKVSNEVIGMISKEKMQELFDVNVFGVLDLTQLVATRMMMRQKSGSIINISSMVGVEGCKGQIAYSASKGAVISMTKSMAKELANYNIRVNAIAPGMIETDRIKETIANDYGNVIPEIALGRLGRESDVAYASLYLASDESDYVTGQILSVSGGIKL